MTPPVAARQRAAARIVRFDAVQRTAHWLNAVLFGILMVTALPLYFGSIGGVVVPRALVAEIHLWAGIALPVPLLISILGSWGAQFRRDLRRINRWTRDEVTWLKALGRRAPQVVDKFNPGQKLNAIFTGAAIVVMLATGAILKWFRFFPVDWRTGATFVHDVFAFAIFIVVAGHVLFALAHPDSLRSMIRGWVTQTWAARHAPGWLAEEQSKVESDVVSDRA
ncbi:MAG: cytochrome b/b6 domain-containing protein [Acidimicrobiales bacterium]